MAIIIYCLLYLAIIGSCHVRNEANNAVASATFLGGPPRTTYSCVANDNCDNEVHVIGNYISNGQSDFQVHNDGLTNLYLTVTGSSSRPLILVLVSYEHVQWTLHIPSGVVIDRVIIVSSFGNSEIPDWGPEKQAWYIHAIMLISAEFLPEQLYCGTSWTSSCC